MDAFNFEFGAIYYLLVNGWYLGAWGDFDSCINGDTTYGQYILVTINGIYNQSAIYTRGSIGRFSNFSTNIGLCMPV